MDPILRVSYFVLFVFFGWTSVIFLGLCQGWHIPWWMLPIGFVITAIACIASLFRLLFSDE
jgi:hypothetical protein